MYSKRLKLLNAHPTGAAESPEAIAPLRLVAFRTRYHPVAGAAEFRVWICELLEGWLISGVCRPTDGKGNEENDHRMPHEDL